MKDTDIAIIGIGGKYPKTPSAKGLWNNLLTNEDLITQGQITTRREQFVNQYYAVDRIGYFDEKRFKFTPLEAELTDPQHRILLTCVHEALVDAGYLDEPPNLKFAVFATTSISSYLLNVLLGSNHYDREKVNYPILIGNDKDFLATKIAYKLNFTGPALTIQCACSSSLVALHHGCMSLRNQECDLSVVGGVSISVPQEQGYFYQEGGILSSDGICRPFDASANGTIKGNGCSVVILKRLSDAIRDEDNIYAVVKGTAINNDGAKKVGFTAPSIEGQSSCIQHALLAAGLSPEQIDTVETHGTGTKLGDLIELAALHQVFGKVEKKIPLGSLKANLGHLDVAAGLTSVIKLIYVLRHGTVPLLKHFQTLNPDLKPYSKPFEFPKQPIKMPLRHASVSSFGIGGTNAHAILAKYESNKPPKPRQNTIRPLKETEFWVHSKNIQTSKPKNLSVVLSAVIETWIDTIGNTSIDSNSVYADIGGDSLTAVEILDRLSKRFSTELALNLFKPDITPQVLAEKIENLRAHRTSNSLFVQAKKSSLGDRSIFLIHPAGGTTFCYYSLIRALKGEYNVFVIDLPPNYSLFGSMQELGDLYLKEIQKWQPKGPYWIGGYSFGGNLAYEIGIQLQKMGEGISKIILFDSHIPEAYTSLPVKQIDYHNSFSKISAYFENKHSFNKEALEQFYSKWIFSHQLLKKHCQVEKIQADITLFAADQEEEYAILDQLNINNIDKKDWGNRSEGQFQEIFVPGNHYTIFDSPALLAKLLDQEMS